MKNRKFQKKRSGPRPGWPLPQLPQENSVLPHKINQRRGLEKRALEKKKKEGNPVSVQMVLFLDRMLNGLLPDRIHYEIGCF